MGTSRDDVAVGIGSNLFNTADNAVVMNTLEENRSFASGMLETTRQMGHTIGTTISATILGLALPVAIDLMPVFEAQAAFRQGFQYSSLAVVWIMAAGAFVAMIQRMPHRGRPAPEQGTGAASQRRRLGHGTISLGRVGCILSRLRVKTTPPGPPAVLCSQPP